MKNLFITRFILTLFAVSARLLAFGGCYDNAVCYVAYDSTQSNFYYMKSATYYSGISDVYFEVCPSFQNQYTKLKIQLGSSAQWSNGTTGTYAIINPGSSIKAIYSSTCSFEVTFHTSLSSLSLVTPTQFILPSCHQATPITGISDYNGLQYSLANWSNGILTTDSLNVPYISNLYSNSNWLNVTLNSGNCQISKSIVLIPSVLSPMQPELCLVTLDSSSKYNALIWDKQFDSGIIKYSIYKQSTITSQYEKIHEQAFEELSYYTDTASKPNQEIARYKITASDSCGNESAISTNHTTILLSSNQGNNGTVNLFWNAYEGFVYPNFEIWRSANGGSSYNLLSTVANNTFSYIDNNPPANAFYQIRISNTAGCNPRSINEAKSNIVDKLGFGIGFKELKKGNLTIAPNPANLEIIISADPALFNSEFEIFNIQGQFIMSGKMNSAQQKLNIAELSNGTYYLKIKNQVRGVERFVKL